MKRDKNAPRFVSVRQVRDAPTILWDLLEERPAEANISHKAMPTADEHLDFVSHHPYKVWFLIKRGTEWVGAAYLTRARELGVAVFKDYQGQGIGRWAVGEMRRRFPDKPMLANVAPGNEKSAAFFRKQGFALIQHTYSCEPQSL